MLFETTLENKKEVSNFPLCNACNRVGYKGTIPFLGAGHSAKATLVLSDLEDRFALYEVLMGVLEFDSIKETEEYVCNNYSIIQTNGCYHKKEKVYGDKKLKDASVCCFPLFYKFLKSNCGNDKKFLLFLRNASDCELINFYYGSTNYSFDQDAFSSVSPWCGRKIPTKDDFTLYPIIHPLEITKELNETLKQQKFVHFKKWFLETVNDTPRKALTLKELQEKCKNLYDTKEIAEAFRRASKAEFSAFDFETNTLKPENPQAKIYCVSFSIEDKVSYCVPWNKDTAIAFKSYIKSSVPKIAANMKFEDRWCRNHPDIKTEVNNWKHDVMLALHVEDSLPNTKSLKFASFTKLGIPFYASETEKYFSDVNEQGINKIDEIQKTTLYNYCALDSLIEAILYTKWRDRANNDLFDDYKQSEKAYNLLHKGTEVLSKIEANGIKIGKDNLDFLQKSRIQIETKTIPQIESEMKKLPVWKTWTDTYGLKSLITSPQQMGVVLFDKLLVSGGTRSGKSNQWIVDEKSLSSIKDKRVIEFVNLHLKKAKLKKLSTTYIQGISSQIHNFRLHPFYNLVKAVSYRSSSSEPNFQNMPIRNKETSKYIRNSFIPDEGCFLGEFDFSGIEVSMAACYHKDKNMISYLTDDSKDMHGDMGEQIYKIKKSNLSKEDFKKIIRYGAKNKFVFPVFYGSYWRKTAQDLWSWGVANKAIVLNDKSTFGEHLKRKFPNGLGNADNIQQGTFYEHVKQVEEHFWSVRFPEYASWKKSTFNEYQKSGYLVSKTGFRYAGIHGRTQILNFPIQGSAFHMLLWCLTEIDKKIKEHNLKSFISGQIHDSIISNIRVNELRKFMSIAKTVMTKNLLKEFPWIVVPFRVEMELSPTKGTWGDKSVVSLTDDKKLSWNGQLFATGSELNNAMNKAITTK